MFTEAIAPIGNAINRISSSMIEANTKEQKNLERL